MVVTCETDSHPLRRLRCPCGRVVDGKTVWVWHATHGFPLELSLPLLYAEGRVPSWDRLIAAARADGANVRGLLRRLVDTIRDNYSAGDAQVICARLEASQ